MSKEKKTIIYNKLELNKINLIESKKKCEFIKGNLILYIRDKNSLHRALKKGYLEMSEINLSISNEAAHDSFNDMSNYEAMLSECDFEYGSEYKKRRYILR